MIEISKNASESFSAGLVEDDIYKWEIIVMDQGLKLIFKISMLICINTNVVLFHFSLEGISIGGGIYAYQIKSTK